jgi:carboxypeptidase PM20D1
MLLLRLPLLLLLLLLLHAQVWERLRVERLGKGNHSYLITWQGSQPGLQPALFISHLDVVPVTPGTEQDWTHPPFSGQIADGFIWGEWHVDIAA